MGRCERVAGSILVVSGWGKMVYWNRERETQVMNGV